MPPGPFAINYIPVITGQGDVSVVTTDLLGRQQVVNVPYYASQQLLRKGLQDFSYEAGFIRENYGINNYQYGQFMMTGTHRLGITDRFTGEMHGEVLSNQQTMGVGGSFLWSTWGVVNLAMAGSHANGQGIGALGLLGFQHQTFQGLSNIIYLEIIIFNHFFWQAFSRRWLIFNYPQVLKQNQIPIRIFFLFFSMY